MAYPKQRREERKEINVLQVASFLQNAFNWATRHMGFKNSKGTQLYDLQCEMMWLIHEITHGPRYIAPKHILSANELIDSIVEQAVSEGRHFDEEELYKWRRKSTS